MIGYTFIGGKLCFIVPRICLVGIAHGYLVEVPVCISTIKVAGIGRYLPVKVGNISGVPVGWPHVPMGIFGAEHTCPIISNIARHS